MSLTPEVMSMFDNLKQEAGMLTCDAKLCRDLNEGTIENKCNHVKIGESTKKTDDFKFAIHSLEDSDVIQYDT